MDVAHVEAGPLTAQPAGSQCAQAALVGQLGEGVGLIHELAQLAAAEKLARGGDDRPDVDQAQGRDLLRLTDRHALAHDALHAQKADTQLVLDQFADRLDAPVAQVVDIVGDLAPVVDVDDAADNRDDVFVRQDAGGKLRLQLQLAVELVAPHAAEIVATRAEEQILQEIARVVQGRRIAGAQFLVEFEQRVIDPLLPVIGRIGCGIPFQGRLDEGMVLIVIDTGEQGPDLLIGAEADGAQQDRNRQLALTVDLHADNVPLAGLEFQPGAAAWDQLGAGEVAAGAAVLFNGEVDAG